METQTYLENEVKKKMVAVENAINGIASIQEKLCRNVQQIHAEIHSDISKVLECIRMRESFLNRQADTILSVKDEILQHQLYELNQAVGILKEGMAYVEKNRKKPIADINEHLQGVLRRVCDVALKPIDTSSIVYHADVDSVTKDCINQFGYVGKKSHSEFDRRRAFMDPSLGPAGGQSLPSRFEEYGDLEQQMLCKPVAPHGAPAGNVSVRSASQLLQSMEERDESGSGGGVPFDLSSIQKWLLEMKVSPEPEPPAGTELQAAGHVVPDLEVLSATTRSAAELYFINYFKSIIESPTSLWLLSSNDAVNDDDECMKMSADTDMMDQQQEDAAMVAAEIPVECMDADADDAMPVPPSQQQPVLFEYFRSLPSDLHYWLVPTSLGGGGSGGEGVSAPSEAGSSSDYSFDVITGSAPTDPGWLQADAAGGQVEVDVVPGAVMLEFPHFRHIISSDAAHWLSDPAAAGDGAGEPISCPEFEHLQRFHDKLGDAAWISSEQSGSPGQPSSPPAAPHPDGSSGGGEQGDIIDKFVWLLLNKDSSS